MLVQHLLTWRIFKGVFGIGDFMQKNVIAREIEKVILTIRAFSREDFLKTLNPFYGAMENAAETITDFTEKQTFLNTVYERSFRALRKWPTPRHRLYAAAARQFHGRQRRAVFAKNLENRSSDKDVHILDPFTGTGNFIVNIMRRIPRPRCRTNTRSELHCNEIMLLPYYVASMNIEHAYLEATGKYEPFEGICLVDTFQTAEKRADECRASSTR